mmetsp:Transcript_102713/g.286057  ORF Transcript_102713/g.286057 Transcript_102713/m.286057 type:complete len:97 (+) Transcript_102713:503-793(+)
MRASRVSRALAPPSAELQELRRGEAVLAANYESKELADDDAECRWAEWQHANRNGAVGVVVLLHLLAPRHPNDNVVDDAIQGAHEVPQQVGARGRR